MYSERFSVFPCHSNRFYKILSKFHHPKRACLGKGLPGREPAWARAFLGEGPAWARECMNEGLPGQGPSRTRAFLSEGPVWVRACLGEGLPGQGHAWSSACLDEGSSWVRAFPRSTLNKLVIFYWNFLLGGSHLSPPPVNMSTSIIWCDSNIKV